MITLAEYAPLRSAIPPYAISSAVDPGQGRNRSSVQNGAMEMPNCPVCAQKMTLVRIISPSGGLPKMDTYQCTPCGTVFIEPNAMTQLPPDRAISLHFDCCGGRA